MVDENKSQIAALLREQLEPSPKVCDSENNERKLAYPKRRLQHGYLSSAPKKSVVRLGSCVAMLLATMELAVLVFE